MAIPQIILSTLAELPLVVPEDQARESVELDVTVPDQQRTNWCWAAVAVGIGRAYGGSPTQCGVAAKVLTLLNRNVTVRCCVNGSKRDCNGPQKLSTALMLPGQVHLQRNDFSVAPPQTSWAFIKNSIDAGRPIAVRIGFPGVSSGHVIVIHGYDTSGGGRYVLIGDPSSVTAIVPLATLIRGYLGGVWHSTYLTSGSRPVPRK